MRLTLSSVCLLLSLPILSQANIEYTHSFSPIAIYLEGTAWNESIILKEFEKAQKIYDQCQIKIELAKIEKLQPIDGQLDILGQYDLELVKRLNEPQRPLVFFLRSLGLTEGLAHGDDYAPNATMKDLTYTAWLGSGILGEDYKVKRHSKYSTLAHELGHVLCSCHHIEGQETNLMAGVAELTSDKLTKDQCDAFKKSPLVQPIN